MRKYISLSPFWIFSTKNTEEIHIQEMKETKELDIQSRMLNA